MSEEKIKKMKVIVDNNNIRIDSYLKDIEELEDKNQKQKEVLDKIKEKCLSIKGNPEHTIVSKNELVKQFLELLEEIE